MRFPTTINGIPCICEVINYEPTVPMKVYGPGMADADPPEPGEFLYMVRDRRGYPAPWLAKYVTPAVEDRLLEDYLIMQQAETYDY